MGFGKLERFDGIENTFKQEINKTKMPKRTLTDRSRTFEGGILLALEYFGNINIDWHLILDVG